MKVTWMIKRETVEPNIAQFNMLTILESKSSISIYILSPSHATNCKQNII